MTREDIIRMAREAGLERIYSACDVPNVQYSYEDWDDEIEHFADLVAAAEREACAKLADSQDGDDSDDRPDCTWSKCARHIAEAIRARGEK